MPRPHALIVDDNPLNIDVLGMLLSNEGIDYSRLSTLASLSETVSQMEQVDVVFLDLEFPNGDGFTALDTLKADAHLAGVPIVAYTVHTSQINEARRAGFHSFLGKPLNVRQFPDQLRRILSNQPVWEV
jgi:two-component system, cell cycle response regulator DivK